MYTRDFTKKERILPVILRSEPEKIYESEVAMLLPHRTSVIDMKAEQEAEMFLNSSQSAKSEGAYAEQEKSFTDIDQKEQSAGDIPKEEMPLVSPALLSELLSEDLGEGDLFLLLLTLLLKEELPEENELPFLLLLLLMSK